MWSVVEQLKAGNPVVLAADLEVVAIPRRCHRALLDQDSMLPLDLEATEADFGVAMAAEDSEEATVATAHTVLPGVSDTKADAVMDMVDNLRPMPHLALEVAAMPALGVPIPVVAGMNVMPVAQQAATVNQ